jgi:hypothetical protein
MAVDTTAKTRDPGSDHRMVVALDRAWRDHPRLRLPTIPQPPPPPVARESFEFPRGSNLILPTRARNLGVENKFFL